VTERRPGIGVVVALVLAVHGIALAAEVPRAKGGPVRIGYLASLSEGLGHVVVGMQRQGYAVTLRKLPDDGWNAIFQRDAMLAPDGFANAATPFEAVLRAAWSAVNTRPLSTPGR
jgi:hypothetical protein